MASRIAGITVEINGSTTGLSKALESVNKTIKGTQSQLKDVERLLKLDPTNTQLLTQKQEALKTAVTATKEKLDALKLAQEQAKAKLESGDLGKDKYDALQREIIETEQQLEKLAKEAANANTALTKLGDAGKKLESVGGSISSVGSSLTKNVTAPIAAIGTIAVKTTADFDAQMSKVQAISGATGEQFDALRDKAREMGAKTKFSATEAGAAFEYMAMAGWKTDDMLEGIEGIMSLAAASGEDLALTSDIVTDALTAFGLSAKDSGHFADILAAASSNANTNVAMLGESFKYAAPVAGALGISAEDTSLALGLMANAGIKASQAGTVLRSGLSNLVKPTDQMATYMEKYNVALVANEDGSINLRETLISLRANMGSLSEAEQAAAASAIFGKEAMSGWLALINASDADFDKLTAAIDNCDGSAEKMAATMQNNLSGQITILKSALQELMIQIGDALMPIIQKLVAHVQSFVERLQKMDEGTRNAILRVAAFAAAIGPLLLVIGKLTAAVGSGMQAISSMGKGILTFVNQAKLGVGAGGKLASALAAIGPVGWAIVAVIAVLAAAFVNLWKNNEEFRDKTLAVWESVKAKFSEAAQKITDAINSLGFEFEGLGEAIKAAWDWLCNMLEPLVSGVIQNLSTILMGLVDVVVGLVQMITGIIKGFKDGDWSQFLEGLKSIWNGVWSVLTSPAKAVFNAIGGYLEKFGTSWEGVWTAIRDFFTGIWDSITSFFSSTWNSISSTASSVWSSIQKTATSVWTAIKDFFTGIWDGIRSFFANTWNAISSTASSVWNAISNAASTAWETIKNVVQVGIMAIKELFSAAVQILTLPFRFIWENCKDILVEAWESIKTTVSTAIDAVKTKLTETWNAIWSAISPILETIKNGVSTAWENVKTTVTGIMDSLKTGITAAWDNVKTNVITITDAIKTGVTTAWENVKSTVATIMDSIKTGISTAWENVKTTVTGVMDSVKTGVTTAWQNVKTAITPILDGIKTGVTNAWNTAKTNVTTAMTNIRTGVTDGWNSVKTTVSNAVTSVKTSITNGFNTAKNTVTSVFDSIRSKISGVMDSAKSTVQNAINNIKSKFNFSWSLPKLKMPHVKISGSFSLNPPSVPRFSIEWYKKAMEDGMILNTPTIFGMRGNTLLAGGEAGSETVVGTRSLLDMIRSAVASMAGGTTINYGGVTINVYQKENQDIRALADEIEYRINNNVMRRKAALGT